MPEIRDYYTAVKDMDIPDLHARRNELVGSTTPGQYRDLPDETLAELLAIARELRKRAAISPKRTAGPRKPKADKQSLDSLI